LQVLRVKLDLIDSNWQKFEATHERLAEYKIETLLDNDYFKRGIFDHCLQYYAEAKAELNIQIEEKEKTNPLSGSQLANLTVGTQRLGVICRRFLSLSSRATFQVGALSRIYSHH
jgi:hypothetical protein